MTEYVKVEALISPKYTQKFLIPVDVPYREKTGWKRGVHGRPRTTADSKSQLTNTRIGKLKMRKITDLQRPRPQWQIPAAFMDINNTPQSQMYGINNKNRINERLPEPRYPECFCQLCVRSAWIRSFPSLPVAYPRPQLNISLSYNQTHTLWRPFM